MAVPREDPYAETAESMKNIHEDSVVVVLHQCQYETVGLYCMLAMIFHFESVQLGQI